MLDIFGKLVDINDEENIPMFDLLTYLKRVLYLESEAYKLEYIQNGLEQKKRELYDNIENSRERIVANKKTYKIDMAPPADIDSGKKTKFLPLLLIVLFSVTFTYGIYVDSLGGQYVIASMLISATMGLACAIAIKLSRDSKIKKIQEKQILYKERYDAELTKKQEFDIAQIKQINSQLKKSASYYKSKVSQLDHLQLDISSLRNRVCEMLDQLYSVNIIYYKYRGLVPISMFVEYIESGRCNALIGHEGAYNLYEQEIQMKRIEIELVNIADHLNEIKANQHRLYTVMQDISDCTAAVFYEINDLNKTTKLIQQQVRDIEVKAQNLDHLDYLETIHEQLDSIKNEVEK